MQEPKLANRDSKRITNSGLRTPKVALVHDWLVSPGGAEKVVYELHKLWPEAPIYTTAYAPEKFPEFAGADVRPLWLDRLPLMRSKHQLFPLVRALAWNLTWLRGYDIVIISSTAEAKYVRTGRHTLRLCYCHTPVRYYWSDYGWYRQHPPFGRLNWLAQMLLPMLIGPLRWVDYRGARRIHRYIANSAFVQRRIKRYYRRDSEVIYPPILTGKFKRPRDPRDFYLIVGRQVAYKRLDLAVDAFNKLGLPLVVAGAGEEIEVQRPRAGANISLLGRVSDERLAELLAQAKALVFPQEEDFGMIPVEAMAAGCPVVAYGKGGALESVVEGVTGTFFHEQTPAALEAAVRKFEGLRLDEEPIRARAAGFDEQVFRNKMREFVERSWAEWQDRA